MRRTPMNRPALPRAARAAAAAVLLLASTACIHEDDLVRQGSGLPPAPGRHWSPPPEAVTAGSPGAGSSTAPGPDTVDLPERLTEPGARWGLPDLIDLALRTSPRTRIAWSQARAAAADLGAEKGQRYPSIAAQVSAVRQKGSAIGGQFTFTSTSVNPYLQLGWVLFDFGRRSSTIDAAQQTLIAADWSSNQVIQDVILEVERAYYQYLDARALEEAQKAAVEETETSYDAADRRRAAGLATVADVLQAKTRLSEARLLLQSAQGQVRTIEGALATSVGLPANTHLDVEIPTPEIPRDRAAVEIDKAIQEAQARRPDLAAARALAKKAEADLRAVDALDRPSLNLGATTGRIYYDGFDIHADTYAASLLLTIPIFNGFTLQHQMLGARERRDEAQARLEDLEQQATLQVWTSYFEHQTADTRIETVHDLVESAQQSYEVASARYDAGVGSILDLLTAQSLLHGARAQEVRARTDWFLTLAQLAHDTGALEAPAPGPETGPSGEGAP